VRQFGIEPLEDRRLLAWGAFPQLIEQDQAVSAHPTVTGQGVNVAMIDSGVDFSHPRLQGKFWTNPGEVAGNGKDDDNSGYADDTRGWDFYNNDNNPEDQNGHGTATAGIVAAGQFTHGGATYGGIAPGAKIIPLKVSDPSGGYSLAFAQRTEKALQWIEKNHQRYNIGVVSMSIRIDPAHYNGLIADEVSRLSAAGVLMLAAAGQVDPDDDAHYPAADPKVYGVSVVQPNDTFAPDTFNRGPGIDLLAPGSVPVLLRGGGSGQSANATSYATPHAAAAAALLMQVNPNLSAAQIIQILKNSGKSVRDTSTGYTHSGLTYRRLDVAAAVEAALDTLPAGDTTKPTATATAAPVTKAGATSYTFTVTYADAGGVRASTIGTGDVRVTGPNGFSQLATLVSVNSSTNGTPRTATYRITPPGGSWGATDNGTYTISLVAGQVSDTSDNTVNAATLATSSVSIAGSIAAGQVTGVVYYDADGDGVKDANEKTPLSVILYADLDNDGVRDPAEPAVTSKAKSGNFTMTLAAGTYNIRQVVPVKYRQTFPRKYHTVTVTANQAVGGLAFSDTNMAFASGVVFQDANANGVQDTGEAGLANRRAYIDANNDGVFQSTEKSVISDATGYIAFNTLPSGTYVIRLAPTTGWTATNTVAYTLKLKAGNIKRGLIFGQDQ
jgi:hypothetical protein